MSQRKPDIRSIVGFALIGVVNIYIMTPRFKEEPVKENPQNTSQNVVSSER